jgi:hypothetical protein
MPHKDGERKREYHRQYMRERRAAAKGRPGVGAAGQESPPTVRDELVALTAGVAQLEADLAATRAART